MEQTLITYLNEYGILSIFISFLIGVISSLNPCSFVTLPFLITSSLTLSNGLTLKNKKLFIYKYTIFFFIGLIISYSLLLLLLIKLSISFINSKQWIIYFLIATFTFLIVLYSLKIFKIFNTNKLIEKLLKYKFRGAFLIGILHGFISSPCGTAPFIAILTLALQSTWIGSYTLLFSFSLGQGAILLLAGLFIGIFQTLNKNRVITTINKFINTLFIAILFLMSLYFFYKAYIYF